MRNPEMDRRVTRLEARHEALETYLPALLDSMQRSQEQIRNDVRAAIDRVEQANRFTRLERLGVIAALFAIAVGLFVIIATVSATVGG